jgi:hypothetical protein
MVWWRNSTKEDDFKKDGMKVKRTIKMVDTGMRQPKQDGLYATGGAHGRYCYHKAFNDSVAMGRNLFCTKIVRTTK